MNATERDRDILARTLYGEARGGGFAGQVAVACVIRNRVNDGRDKSMVGRGLCRGLPEAVPVQLLEQKRPELSLPERRHIF